MRQRLSLLDARNHSCNLWPTGVNRETQIDFFVAVEMSSGSRSSIFSLSIRTVLTRSRGRSDDTNSFAQTPVALQNIFTRDSIYAIARTCMCHANSVCLSICPSVCLLHACIVSKRLNASSKFFHRLIGPSF